MILLFVDSATHYTREESLIFALIFMSPIILTVLYLCFKIIWAEFQHRRRMKSIENFGDFHRKLMSWSNTIKDKQKREEYLIFCLNLIDYKAGTKNMTDFNEDEQLKMVEEKFGKWIPELQQKTREEQIEKILS